MKTNNNARSLLVKRAREEIKEQIDKNLIWMPWENVDALVTVGEKMRMNDMKLLRSAGIITKCRTSGLVTEELEIYLCFRFLSENYTRDIASTHLNELKRVIREDYKQNILPQLAQKLSHEVQIPGLIDFVKAKVLYERFSISYKQFWKDIRSLKECGIIEGIDLEEEEKKPFMGYMYPDIWKYLIFRTIHGNCDRTAAFYYINPCNTYINNFIESQEEMAS